MSFNIDFDRIPKRLYDELVHAYGKEEAEKFIIEVDYDFSTLNRALQRT